MTTPKEVQHLSHKYKDSSWRDYTAEELGNWVHLFLKRAKHRTEPDKIKKDLTDARNYALFLLAMVEETAEEWGVELE